MRRAVVLAVLLAVMIGVTHLSTSSDNPHDPLTLAAIGFVVLAAFTIAEVASSLGLPRVTGYIVGGVVLGPSAADILSTRVVGEMRMFNTLALGLIAISAGLELDVRQIRKIGRTLGATIGIKVVLGGLVVGGTLVAVQTISPVLPLTSQSEVIAMALIMAALSIGTSPSISLAVMNESRARGRLMDLVLGSAVLKDLVVVVLLALTVAIAKTLLAPGVPLDAEVLWDVAIEIGSSAAAGSVLGVLLILYIRYVHAEMLFVVAATILVVSEVGKALHLELLLVFITAGFVVRNFSKHGHALLKPIEMVALPVFVVFFTIAGASVDLGRTLSVLPLAFALCVARAFVYVVASRFGGRIGGEEPRIQRMAWLGYLPQAGVTLGLVGIAASQVAELSTHIATTGMAVVAVNLLVGPVTLRRALRALGEIPGDIKQPAGVTETNGAKGAAAPASKRPTELQVAIEHGPLAQRVHRSLEGTRAIIDAFIAMELKPFASALAASATAPLGNTGPSLSQGLRDWGTQPRGGDPAQRAELFKRLFEELAATLGAWPEVVVAPFEPGSLKIEGSEGRLVKLRKRLFLAARKLSQAAQSRARKVPARLAARVTLEPAMAAIALETLRAWAHAEAQTAVLLRRTATGELSPADAHGAVGAALAAFAADVEERAKGRLVEAHARLVKVLATVDGPELSASELRYSRTSAEVKASLARLPEEAKTWAAKLVAARGSLSLACVVAGADQRVRRSVEERLLKPMSDAANEVAPAIGRVRERIAALGERLDGPIDPGEVLVPVLAECRSAFPSQAEQALEVAAAHFRASTALHALAVDLRELVSDIPESLTVLRDLKKSLLVERPANIATRTVSLREIAGDRLVRELLPAIDEDVREASAMLIETGARVRSAIDVAVHAVEARVAAPWASAEEDDALREGVARSIARLAAMEAEIAASAARRRDAIAERAEAVLVALAEDTSGKGATTVVRAAESGIGRLGRSARARFSPVRAKISQTVVALRTFLRRVSGGDLSHDLRLRYAKEAPDAGEIRAYVERARAMTSLPPAYARLFDPGPIRDHRIFTANRDKLEAALGAERSWLAGGPSSALIVGKHGAGRTSILNLCELEMSVPRVVRPTRLRWSGSVSFLDAIAYELDCKPRASSILAALGETKTAIVLDDLEQWIAPTPAGLASLEQLLSLVVDTQTTAFWLVAVEQGALEALEDALPVRQAFGRVVTIEPLKADALLQAVEARHRLSGRDIVHPKNVATRLIGRLRRESDHRVFFRVMASATGGNIARALDTWMRAVEVTEGGEVVPHIERVFARGLPFLSHLPARQVALLVALLRFGPMDRPTLSDLLGVSLSETERHVSFLLAASILEGVGATELVHVAPRIRGATLQGLHDEGVWR